MKGFLRERLNSFITKKLMYFINLSETLLIENYILIF